jgi:hypothetical protein
MNACECLSRFLGSGRFWRCIFSMFARLFLVGGRLPDLALTRPLAI